MEKLPPFDKNTRIIDVPIVDDIEYDYDDMDFVVDDRHNPEDKTIPMTVIIPKPFKSNKQRDNKLAKLDMDALFSFFYDPDLTKQKPKPKNEQCFPLKHVKMCELLQDQLTKDPPKYQRCMKHVEEDPPTHSYIMSKGTLLRFTIYQKSKVKKLTW